MVDDLPTGSHFNSHKRFWRGEVTSGGVDIRYSKTMSFTFYQGGSLMYKIEPGKYITYQSDICV